MEAEEERQACRRMRIEEMKREKRKAGLLRGGIGIVAAAAACCAGIFLGIVGAAMLRGGGAPEGQNRQMSAVAKGGNAGRRNMAHLAEGLVVKGADVPARSVPGSTDVLAGVLPDEAGFQAGVLPDEAEALAGAMSVGAGFQAGIVTGEADTLLGAMPDEADLQADIVPAGASALVDALPGGEVAPTKAPLFEVHSTSATMGFGDNIVSRYGIVIDVEDGIVLAEKEAKERMNPASMTKLLTVLVAAEHISQEELEETVAITIDITDYCYLNNCSITGYDIGEAATVRDLFYGTILPSGADSAMALAVYVAGSQEAFVELMNEKLEEMGLAETTHFTNCVGLYHEEHYSTAYDMAMILKAAMDNEFCRDVLYTRLYNTAPTEQHPEGLWMANKFLRQIEEIDTHGEVLCAKTGYVSKAGCCAASFCLGNDGRAYLCVTAGASNSRKCIEDQAELYRTFIPTPIP